MKPLFRFVPWVLGGLSLWLVVVCASLLSWDERGNLIAHSYSVWGDWSAHFAFISGLRERGLSWIFGENPIFAGVPFQYPFLSHLLTALFGTITFTSVITSSTILSLALMAVLPWVLYRWFRALGLTPISAFFSIIAFLLIGGLQFWDSDLSARDPLTNQFNSGSVFTQFILFEFYPQRAFLFGLVVLCFTFTYALRVKTWTTKKAVGVGAALSLLAWMHIHSWIAMGAALLFSWLIERRKVLRFGLGVATGSFILLALLLLRDFDPQYKHSWEWFFPGWAQNPAAGLSAASDMNPIWFWIYNTGVFLPLALAGTYWGRMNLTLRALAVTGWTLFGIAELINLQPYFYDNLKLFTYAFFFLSPLVGVALERIGQLSFPRIPSWVMPIVAVTLLIFQSFSAISDLESMRKGLQQTVFFSTEELDLADRFKDVRKSADSIVLIQPRHNHWVPCLTGNPVPMGYAGWLWTWGIQYRGREAQVNEILLGGPSAEENLKQLKVEYVALQKGGRVNEQPVNTAFFDARFKKVLESPQWVVYSKD